MKKILTLGMVCEEKRLLLGMKKRGFGAGRWNGFGGKVEAGESIEAAAQREMEEEVSLMPLKMTKVGILEFAFLSSTEELEVHIFKVTDYKGKPVESEEMRPQWFAWDAIPFPQMWADDEYWIPYLQSGELFRGRFLFDAPATAEHAAVIIEHRLAVVSDF